MNRIQDRQGNALELMNQDGFSDKQVSQTMNELRVKTEQLKKLKAQLLEAEKTNKGTHASMMRLEQTIKELKGNALD